MRSTPTVGQQLGLVKVERAIMAEIVRLHDEEGHYVYRLGAAEE